MDEVIEAMARAYCISGGFDPDEPMPNDGPRWRYYAEGCAAAYNALRAKLVPVGYQYGNIPVYALPEIDNG